MLLIPVRKSQATQVQYPQNQKIKHHKIKVTSVTFIFNLSQQMLQ